jgi:acyl carrier protein phosphodiesterase
MKRLTIDIPLSLHQRVKSRCALQGEKMADVVRGLLEKQFPPEEQGSAAAGQGANP